MKTLCRLTALTGLGLLALTASAGRGMQVEGMEVIPSGTARLTDADLWVESLSPDGHGRALANDEVVNLGELLKVCFFTTEAGYVTLWSRDAEADVVRLYPNAFSPGGEAGSGFKVAAEQQVCVGDDENFRLRVVEPRGENWVYLHWTPDAAMTLPGDAFPDMDAFARSIRRESLGDTDNYADRRVRFFVE